jgi:O-antigen/teichoic acid export membrane protein
VSDDATVAVDEAAGSPPPKSLKTRAIHAIGWTLASDGGSQVIRLISTIVLTRLLLPDMFGLMAVVTIIQDGLNMFSDVGVQPAIVQHKRGDDRDFLDTAWTIQSIRGAILWLAASLLAWPASVYTKQPELVYLLPVVGFNSLLDGMVSTKVHTCDRHLALGRLTLINLGTAFLGLLVRIGWAIVSPTVWALVAGGIVGTIARVALGHWILQGPVNRFRWGREELKALVGFGRWVFVSTLLTFVASRLDKLVFARIVPISMFGIYNIGQSMCRLPMDALQRMGSSVAFPVFSRLKERDGDVASAYARMRAPLLVGGGTVLSALTLGGPLVAQLLFPAKYHDAGWIMQIVAVAMWFQALESTNASVLLASALPKWLAIGNFVKILLIAAVLPIAYLQWGFPGALVGMSLVEIPKYLVEAGRVRRLGLPGWATEFGLTAAVLFCAGVALALHFWNPAGGPWLKLSIAAACGVVVWTPLLWWAVRTAKFKG